MIEYENHPTTIARRLALKEAHDAYDLARSARRASRSLGEVADDLRVPESVELPGGKLSKGDQIRDLNSGEMFEVDFLLADLEKIVMKKPCRIIFYFDDEGVEWDRPTSS